MEGVVVVNSDKMGQGDDELGIRLLANFLGKQMDAETKPKMLVLYNSGVKLAAKGSPVLESLQSLENLGVDNLLRNLCQLLWFDRSDRFWKGDQYAGDRQSAYPGRNYSYYHLKDIFINIKVRKKFTYPPPNFLRRC